MPSPPVNLFISYSHRDEALRDALIRHIALLERQGLVAAWYDRMIAPGDGGDDEINAHLESADIVVLLISSDFMNSLYCWEKELERSLERHEAGEAVVVPVVVRAVDLEGAPFAQIQSLPTDRKPVTSWSNRDEAWTDVARGLRKAIEKAQARKVRSVETRSAKQVGEILAPSIGPVFEGGAVQTGYVVLDKLLGGIHSSELVVIGGRPSMGKTTLLGNIAMHVAFTSRKEGAVGLFSLETASEPLVGRLISALARVDSNQIRSGRLAEESWPRIDAAMGLLYKAPLYFDDPTTLTTAELLSRARKLKTKHGLGMICVDQLQLLRVNAAKFWGAQTRGEARVTRELKEIARELNVPVLVTSQVNRKVDRRIEKRPTLSDLPEGYELEEHADVVIFIYREEVYDPWTPRRGIADIIVAKQRNGPTGELQLVFSGAHGRFDNYVSESTEAHLRESDPT